MDSLRIFGGVQLLSVWIRLETDYFFTLLAVLLPLVFIVFPRWRYVDALLGMVVFAVCAYFFTQAEPIVDEGWEFGAPELPTAMSIVLWVLLLEAVRRALSHESSNASPSSDDVSIFSHASASTCCRRNKS